MNPLKALQDHRQAVWLDFLSRGFIADGGLKKLVDEKFTLVETFKTKKNIGILLEP